MMIRAGVAGHPIDHSRSPAIHRYWLDRFGIEGTYEAFDPGQADEGFAALVSRLASEGYVGLNVTMPFKAAALVLADEAEETARRVGGANTLTFRDGCVRAANTDGAGFAAALAAHAAPPARALVLGAGGTAPSVLAALEGAEVLLANRTEARAAALAARFGARVVPWDEREAAASDVALVVNATPLGLREDDPLPIDPGALLGGTCVADCVYAPGETPLVRAARARGLPAFDGFFMLVAQAVPGHEAWFGSRIGEGLVAETVAALRP